MQDRIKIGEFINGLPNNTDRIAFLYRLDEMARLQGSDKDPRCEVSVDLLCSILEYGKMNKGRALNSTELELAIDMAKEGKSLKTIAETLDVTLFSLTVHHGVKLGAIISKYQENKNKLLKSVS
jgi:hypothetical protein